MHVVTGILAFAVRPNGTFVARYPDGTVQADYTGSTGHVLLVDQAPLSSDDGDFSLSFGSTEITVTNLAATTLRAGLKFWLQLRKYTESDGKLLSKRADQPHDLIPIDGATLDGDAISLPSSGASGSVGTVDPEGNVTADPGSTYLRTDTSPQTFWVKASGTGNTGWVQLLG